MLDQLRLICWIVMNGDEPIFTNHVSPLLPGQFENRCKQTMSSDAEPFRQGMFSAFGRRRHG